MRARKRFGQNFLHDATIIDNIISIIAPLKQDSFLEIGPGHGALTSSLVASGSKLVAIEIDRDLVSELRIKYSGITIIEEDVLKFDFSTLDPTQQLRVVGNLPYNISTPLLFRLFTQLHRFIDMHFMLQLEVVNRMSAMHSTPAYGRLSVMTQYYCDVTKMFSVPPSAFTPAPKVNSAIVRLTPKQNPAQAIDEKVLSAIVAKAFGQRRKTIRNSLKPLVSIETMEQAGINPTLRPENISLQQYISCANIQAKKNAEV